MGYASLRLVGFGSKGKGFGLGTKVEGFGPGFMLPGDEVRV